MLHKMRDNVYLGDKDAYKSAAQLKELGITSIFVVADDMPIIELEGDQVPRELGIKVWNVGLRADRMNAPHTKDLACHCPKYSVQNGETVLIQSVTGLQRGAYIACRMLCELEGRGIYEIMQELKTELPEFDIGKSYF
jgi:hypothetical protein